MNEKIKALTRIYNNVTLEYKQSNEQIYVWCQIKPKYYKELGLISSGIDEDSAINSVINLQNKVKQVEKTLKGLIESPRLEEQFYENGFVQRVFENFHIIFQRKGNDFYIVNVVKQDKIGFIYNEEPNTNPVTLFGENKFKKVESIDAIIDECKFDKLRELDLEGGELWEWNNIIGLRGSAGLFVLKDGKVLKCLQLNDKVIKWNTLN
jgi:hypothetical protein